MSLFDRTKLNILPLSEKKSKSAIQKIAIDPDSAPPSIESYDEIINRLADTIIQAKQNNASIILAFGVHLSKNDWDWCYAE